MKTLTGKESLGKDGEVCHVADDADAQTSSDKDDADVCSICFERLCNIEVGFGSFGSDYQSALKSSLENG